MTKYPFDNVIEACKWRIKFRDIFHLKFFYDDMHRWINDHGWQDYDEPGTDHYENLFFEKIGLKGDKELWARWRVWKYPHGEKNPYFKYHWNLDFHYLYLQPTEVMRDGKKVKNWIYKGEVELWNWAGVEYDAGGSFSKHPILKYFHTVFPKRIFKKPLFEEHKRELYREVYQFQNFMKQWFKLKRYLPYEETPLFRKGWAWTSHMKE